MIQPSSPKSFSATVTIELNFAGCVYPVAQAGRGRLYFDTPVTLPAGEGQLVITIDGCPRRWRVSNLAAQESVREATMRMDVVD